MAYQLRDQLYAVNIAGQVILLDLALDRYFAAKASMNTILLEFLESSDAERLDETSIQSLLHASLIVPGERPSAELPRASAMIPQRELNGRPSSRLPPFILWRTALIQIAYSASSNRRRLSRFATAIRRARRDQTEPASIDEDRYRIVVDCFSRLDPIFPYANRCLQRTTSFVMLCHQIGLRPSLVVGVQARPFAAHCWAQHGDIVLNDRLENVTHYSPILAI